MQILLTFFKACERCCISKQPQPKVKVPNIYLPPSQRIVSYGFTRLEKASDGRENALVITDVF